LMNMKKYPKYKPSGVEWMGDVPEHWEVKKLKYVSETIQTGKTPPSNEEKYFQDGTVNWFNPSDFSGDIQLKNSHRKISSLAIEENMVKLYKPKTILVVGIGATLGKVGIIDEAGSSNQQINAITVDERMNPLFCAFYLESFSRIIVSLSNASTLAIFNQTQTKNFEIIAPPKSEQNAIISYLDRKTAQIARAIAEKEQLIALYREERQAIINEAVTKGIRPGVKMKPSGVEWIGDVPEGWEAKKLKYFAEIKLGKMLTPDDKGGFFLKPYLRAQNLQWFKPDLNEVKEMWFSDKELENYRVLKDDLLVSEGGEVGRTCIWDNEIKEIYIQNSVNKVAIKESGSPKFFLYCFSSCASKGYFEAMVNRVSIAHLTKEKLKEVEFPFPEPSEQTTIVAYLDQKTTEIAQAISGIEKEIALLQEYRQALIFEAVTGKIDVREAAPGHVYEPL